jgi:NADH:ubiquinone oxidoreductase subunit 2 (subunit N)
MISEATSEKAIKYLAIACTGGIAYRTFGASFINMVLANLGLEKIEPFTSTEVLNQLIMLAGAILAAISGNKFMNFRHREESKPVKEKNKNGP